MRLVCRTRHSNIPIFHSSAILLLGLALSFPTPAPAQRLVGEEAGWETLENCRIVKTWGTDADSFHIVHEGREYVVRLYFVDAPETSGSYPDRVREQAKYFNISPADCLQVGRLAAEFTEQLLDVPFTVVTRWQNAYGNGDLPRFYAAVRVNGEDLSVLLTEQGFARRKGAQASYPDGEEATVYRHRLIDLEEKAKAAGRGGWSDAWERYTQNAQVPDIVTYVPAETKVDLNVATVEDLSRLPGVGPGLAEAIVAVRPFKQFDDLLKVPGIGPHTLEKARPYAKLSDAAP